MNDKTAVQRVAPRERPKVVFEEESRTKQAFKDQVNINKIVARYRKTGMVDHVTSRQGFYGDVSEVKDYGTALQTVIKAKGLFDSLSSEVRARFANDPEKLINFLLDEKNREEAVKLGLLVEKPPKLPEDAPKGADGDKTPK